jgi:hypothetical protein
MEQMGRVHASNAYQVKSCWPARLSGKQGQASNNMVSLSGLEYAALAITKPVASA